MHLALHLRSQILDYGPPSGFWCMPYERMNGLLTRGPSSRSAAAVSTAQRAIKLIIMAAQGDRGVHAPLQSHPGFTHSVRSSGQGNGNQHFYQFTADAMGRDARRRLVGWRNGSLGHEVRGDESFPGQLFMLRRGLRPHTARLSAVADGPSVGALPAPGKERRRRSRLVSMSHVQACIHSHYLVAYQDDLLARLPSPAAKNGFLAMDHGDQLKHPAALEWFATFDDHIQIFDQLMLAGETFGSDVAPYGLNSYASVFFKDDQGSRSRATTYTRWCGRVSFYIEHKYAKVVHRFAMMRWYDWVGQSNARKGEAKDFIPAMSFHFKDCGIDHSTFATAPVVTTSFTPTHTGDLVPVQRIASRWIPSFTFNDRARAPKHQHVCIIPSGAYD